MKLTRLQRHMAYMLLLAVWEEEIDKPDCGSLFGFCITLLVVFGENILLNDFPELTAKKPGGSSYGHWFPIRCKSDQLKRIAILRRCITETADAWEGVKEKNDTI